MTRAVANVPCNGCTACCQHDLVFLHPEQGDIVESFITFEVTNPLTGEHGHALQHKAKADGGGCVYVGPAGCTIHDRVPAVCKAFDCRQLYLDLMSIPRPRRRKLLKQMRSHGLAGNPVLMAGKARLETLP